MPSRTTAVRAAALIATLILIATWHPPRVSAATIRTSDDARTTAASSGTNYGGGDDLNVKYASGTNGERSFLKFDLSAALPAGLGSGDITAASLRLWVNRVTGAGAFDVYEAAGNWAEESITDSNAPSLGTLRVQNVTISSGGAKKFVTIDLTALVRDWLDGVATNYGIVMVPVSGTIDVAFDSKENAGTAHDPQLDVMVNLTADITGVATPGGGGLTGGGASGSLSISIATGGITTTMLADTAVTAGKIASGAVGSATVDSSAVQLRVSGTCAVGNAIRAINANGTVTCEAITAAAPRSHLAGLALSNSVSDPTNDIDIALGEATDSGNSTVLRLTSGLTKQLDAGWVVGTNQGMLDTGAVANNTYHVFLIRRPDTGVVDVLASLSATAPALPTNYTEYRRVGSIIRISGSIKAFTQDGDYFRWHATVLDVNATNPGTSAVTRALTVPTGVNVVALVNWMVGTAGSITTVLVNISDLAANDEAPVDTMNPPLYTLGMFNSTRGGGQLETRTNTSAQVRTRLDSSDGNILLRAATIGWIDRRGRDK